MAARPTTVGELKASGYRPRSVKEEMRDNLIRKIAAGEEIFPGIVGYEETVLPQIENAVLDAAGLLGSERVFVRQLIEEDRLEELRRAIEGSDAEALADALVSTMFNGLRARSR